MNVTLIIICAIDHYILILAIYRVYRSFDSEKSFKSEKVYLKESYFEISRSYKEIFDATV